MYWAGMFFFTPSKISKIVFRTFMKFLLSIDVDISIKLKSLLTLSNSISASISYINPCSDRNFLNNNEFKSLPRILSSAYIG